MLTTDVIDAPGKFVRTGSPCCRCETYVDEQRRQRGSANQNSAIDRVHAR